jgi:hypothetical protein
MGLEMALVSQATSDSVLLQSVCPDDVHAVLLHLQAKSAACGVHHTAGA